MKFYMHLDSLLCEHMDYFVPVYNLQMFQLCLPILHLRKCIAFMNCNRYELDFGYTDSSRIIKLPTFPQRNKN